MDPRILQLLRQQQAQGQQPQGQPIGDEAGFSLGQQFDTNPFESITQGIGRQQAGQGQPMTQGGQPAPQEAGQGAMQPMDPKQDQFQRGSNPGGSKFLLGAVQQLQNYIAESTERDEIAIARSVVQLLTKLIAKEQQKFNDQLAGGDQGAAAGAQPTPQAAPQQGAQQAPQAGSQGQGY